MAAAAASAALIAGAFGPWVTLGIIKASGMDATEDAWVLVGAGVFGLMAAWAGRYGDTKSAALLILAGLGGGAMAIYHIATFNENGRSVFGVEPSVGWGLWIGAAAGVMMILIGVRLISDARSSGVSVLPPPGE